MQEPPLEKTLPSKFAHRSAGRSRGQNPTSRAWSIGEIRTLRSLAESGASMQTIATTLKRTVSAVRNKASFHGISVHSEPRSAAIE